MRLVSKVPASLVIFLVVAILYALQTLPSVGIVLMMFGAPIWTGMLINIGMLGLVLEVSIRLFSQKEARILLIWLLLPLAYFGGYGISAYSDHHTLQKLRAEYDASNAAVSIPFDPERHSLVLNGSAHSYAETLTQNYALPIVYVQNENFIEGYYSTQIIAKDLCRTIWDNPEANAASIYTFGFHDGEQIGSRQMEPNFCSLRMPIKPNDAQITILGSQSETLVDGLPVTLVENLITMPDGREFLLRGGVAAPYPWFPQPILGCGLDSGSPSWECVHGFSRDSFTTIVSSNTRFGGDEAVLAGALDIGSVAPTDRVAVDSQLIANQIEKAIELQLKDDVANLREAASDPTADFSIHSPAVLQHKPDVLLRFAPLIVTGIERAAQISDNPYAHRETGRTLARLFGKLPMDVQDRYTEEMAVLYRRADEANDGLHWLYQADALTRFRR